MWPFALIRAGAEDGCICLCSASPVCLLLASKGAVQSRCASISFLCHALLDLLTVHVTLLSVSPHDDMMAVVPSKDVYFGSVLLKEIAVTQCVLAVASARNIDDVKYGIAGLQPADGVRTRPAVRPACYDGRN